ncbi:MAG: hypothetical protein PSX36_07650 [bacterium]|nr:hypothetical protein [bacterium]
MTLKEKLLAFSTLSVQTRMDAWQDLLGIGQEFISTKSNDPELAKDIAFALHRHRGVMGSSKAYEGATEIDIQLLDVSIIIARIAFGNTLPLAQFLKDAKYYSLYYPTKYDASKIDRELSGLK